MSHNQTPAETSQHLRQTRRFISGGEGRKSERYFVIYVVAVALIMLVAPLFWSATLLLRSTGARLELLDFGWLCIGAVGFLLVVASFLPRYSAPVWTTNLELHYFVLGPFGVLRTLWRRAVLMCVGVLALGLTGAAAVWIASDTSPAQLPLYLALGLGDGALVATALLFNQTPWARKTRVISGVLGILLLVVTWLSGRNRLAGPATVIIFVASLVLLVVLAWALRFTLKRLGPYDLESMTTRRSLAFNGVVVGDARAFAAAPSASAGSRRWRSRFARTLIGRSIQVDLRYCRRSPVSTLLAFIAAVLCITGYCLIGPSAATVTVVFYALQFAIGRWTGALSDVVDSRGADSILSEKLFTRVAAHLIAPVLFLVVAVALGIGVSWLLTGTVIPSAWMLLWVASLATLLRFSTLGGGGLPAVLTMPIATPVGDMSFLVLVLWLLRSLLPGVLLIWLSSLRGIPFALSAVTVLVVIVALVKAWQLLGASHVSKPGVVHGFESD